MWEAIASNRRRSLWLISIMGGVLIILGALIGLLFTMYGQPALEHWQTLSDTSGAAHSLRPPAPPTFWEQVIQAQAGAYFGIAAAVVIWLIMWLAAVGAGDNILLSSVGAKQIRKEDAPQLWNVVEEMAIASGLRKMPRTYIIDDPSPNAFAVGYSADRAAVAVTAGLLKRLNRDELQGVIAHEIGHIRNRDVQFMTLAGVMVGAIVLISHTFLRTMFYTGGRRRSSKGGGQAAAIMMAIAIVVAILAPIAAQMLYFACSRKREYLADASSACYTRYPAGLASALERISHKANTTKFNQVVAPMCIINPLQAHGQAGLFSTHPDIKSRVKILRSMAGAGFAAYEQAFRQAGVKGDSGLGQRTLGQAEDVPLRKPSEDTKHDMAERVKQATAVGAVLERMLPLVVITCACGVKMKLPPNFKRKEIVCPRCGRHHDVPKASAAAAGKTPTAKQLQYQRRGDGWESFQCTCGKTVQISPSFSASQVSCPGCKRRIDILPPQ